MSSKSGVQKQVLSLYRAALRVASHRASAEERTALREYARAELERHRASVPRSDTLRIEHLLRSGRKRLESVASAARFSLARAPTKDAAK
jgi:succinate dehydrogenase assembly factor 1